MRRKCTNIKGQWRKTFLPQTSVSGWRYRTAELSIIEFFKILSPAELDLTEKEDNPVEHFKFDPTFLNKIERSDQATNY